MFLLFIPFFLFAGVIENNITSVYKQAFDNIQIDKVILKYYGKKPKKIEYINISSINPKNPKGIVKLNNYKFVYYKLLAKIRVLKSTKIINKNDIINSSNSKLTYITFKNLYKMPLTKIPKNSSAKFYIPQNKIIYNYMVTTPNVVQRNSPITIISQSGGIQISFSATALQNGKPGDIIKVRDENNKIYKVKIDKNGNGEL
jgi:flagella basal body P-ring formation protein FlgA